MFDAHEKFSGLSRLEVGESVELMRVLTAAGLGLDWGREMIRNPDLARNMLDAHLDPTRKRVRPKFVNRYFVPPQQQIHNIRRWNKEFSWGFTERDIASVSIPPQWPEGELISLVLVPYISLSSDKSQDSLAQGTFQALVNAILTTQPNVYMTDTEFEGGHFLFDWQPTDHHLRWELIDLKKSSGVRPGRRREFVAEGKLPHAAVLAAVAHHPEWVRCMNGIQIPYVWLGGLRFRPKNKDVRREVRIRWDYPAVRISLFDFPEGEGLEERFNTTSVPEFIK